MTVTRIKQLSFLSAVLSTVLSSGCMVGPDYRVPETQVNDAWIEESGQAVKRDTAIDAASYAPDTEGRLRWVARFDCSMPASRPSISEGSAAA